MLCLFFCFSLLLAKAGFAPFACWACENPGKSCHVSKIESGFAIREMLIHLQNYIVTEQMHLPL